MAIALAHSALDDLRGESAALAALSDLFFTHGRRKFKAEPRPDVAWCTGRGGRQLFAHAIAVLHAKRYLRWHPDGRYSVISRRILSDVDYARDRFFDHLARGPYPAAALHIAYLALSKLEPGEGAMIDAARIARAGHCSVRKVRKTLAALVQAGLIVVTATENGAPTRYTIEWARWSNADALPSSEIVHAA